MGHQKDKDRNLKSRGVQRKKLEGGRPPTQWKEGGKPNPSAEVPSSANGDTLQPMEDTSLIPGMGTNAQN